MLKGPIALGAIRTSFVLGARLVVQAGTLFLLALILGPEEFGLYAGFGVMAVLLGSLATFGTHLTLLRDVSRSPNEISESLRLALGTTACCGSFLLLIYLIFSQFLLQIPRDVYWIIFYLGFSEILFQPFLTVAAMELHGRGQIAGSQLLLIQPLILRLLTVLVIAGFSPVNPLEWYALGHLCAVMVPLAYMVWSSSIEWHQPFLWRIVRRSELKGLSGYALMNVSANGVTELDKMLATRLLSSNAAGIYAAASRIVSSFVLPIMALVLAAMPRLFRDGAVAGKTLQYWLFFFAAVYGILAAIAIILAAPRIELLLGADYVGARDFIQLLALAVPAVCVRATATNILTTLERPWVRISLEFFGWVVILLLAIIFVKKQGDLGLSFSIVCAEWLLAIGSVILVNNISTSSDKSSSGEKQE